jgi:FkbM family methyltransferase
MKSLRDFTIKALMLLPLSIRLWLLSSGTRPLLWLLFHLETEAVTIAPMGPGFCRYPMWFNWQSATPMVLGAYEPEVAELLRREIKAGALCMDIGAHVGYYAILMARLTGEAGTVVAFEPVPENFEMIKKNVVLNSLGNVRLEPLAVSGEDGTLKLTLRSDEKLTFHASACDYDIGDRRKVIDVVTCSLDGYLARFGRVPDLLQIDVEGAELAVLHGAEATLRKARPKLLIEIHGWGSPESVKVSEYLSSFGYKRTILGSRGSEVFAFFRPCDQASGIAA